MIGNFLKIGIDPELSLEDSKSNIANNRINIVLIPIFIFSLILDLIELSNGTHYNQTGYISSSILILLCLFHLLLNKFGLFKVTRILILFDIMFVTIYLTPLTGKVIEEYYFWHHFFFLGMAFVPFVLFPEKKNVWIVVVSLSSYNLAIFFEDNILNLLSDETLEIQTIVKQNIIFYKAAPVLVFSFITIVISNYVNSNLKFEKELKKSKDIIDKRNTELSRINEELLETIATKDRFFRIIGHDLKGPISQMILFSEMIENHYNKLDEEKIMQIVKVINKSSYRGIKLLENLLEWAQTQSGCMQAKEEALHLGSIINETIELLKYQADFKNITIELNIDDEFHFCSDKNMIQTIIRNLISNAIKFTPREGKITITSALEKESITISISDTGMGMSENELSTLFKIDKTRSKPGTENEAGTGIGLILCNELALKLSGSISVSSVQGSGSTFSIKLPYKKSPL